MATPVKALYDYKARSAEELSLSLGKIYQVYSFDEASGWGHGFDPDSEEAGWFPLNYITKDVTSGEKASSKAAKKAEKSFFI